MIIPVLLFLQVLYWNGEARVALPASMPGRLGIAGGKDADITEAPYVMSLLRKGFTSCSATLIGKDVALTSAQCIYLYSNPDPSFFEIRAGSSKIDDYDTIFKVRKVLTHPKYHNFNYDIAILWLATPVVFNDKIAATPMKNQGEEVNDGEILQVTGWGYNRDWDFPMTLQKVLVQKVNSSACAEQLEVTITPQMMCAGVPEGGKGFCDYDYGSPLMHDGKLTGLASRMMLDWNFECASKDFSSQVYTKVSALRSWIDENIQKEAEHNSS